MTWRVRGGEGGAPGHMGKSNMAGATYGPRVEL